MKIAKKYKIALLVVAIGISSFLGTLASTMGVDAANNECSSGYTASTYMNNISYNVSGKLACNELVSLESLFKFCMALKQNIWDIVVLKNKNKNEFKGDFL